ncbi:MAG: redoxin domain-containing protein [Chloroflexi bacterium]|nr:redoxin domain-containing protein [Chloroflexota bacterium]
MAGCLGPAAREIPPPGEVDVGGPPGVVRIGRLAPAFELRSPDGTPVRLAEYRGKTVLLNFWASWCVPCREEMPELEAVYRSQQARDLVVIGINSGEPASVALAFARDLGITFPIALDQDGLLTVSYQVLGLPVTYLVDRDGVLRDRFGGSMTRSEMETRLDRTRAGAGRPMPTPVSIAAGALPTAGEVAVDVGGRRITRGEVDRRLDLQLALERARTGEILDLGLAEGRLELERRRAHVLEEIIDEELLTRAARAAGMSDPTPSEVEAEVARMAAAAGGQAEFSRGLEPHGVTLNDLREVFPLGMLADRFIDQRLLTADAVGSPGEITRRWLASQRTMFGLAQRPEGGR